MTDAEIETIGKLAEMCRKHGIKLVEIPNIVRMEVELVPVETKPVAKKDADADLCGCGHPEFAHTNGLCVLGCDAEKCAAESGKSL